MSVWEDEMKEFQKKRREWFYRSPLPKKKQRTSTPRGRSGKVHTFSEEEIFLFKIRRFAKARERREKCLLKKYAF